MLRSAEQLTIDRTRVATQRVRIQKRIVEELRTIEVPVRVERLVITHEPLEGPSTADGLAPEGVADLEFVLREEVPVVTLEARPVERVRVGVRTVTAEQTVTADLASEQVVVETFRPHD